MRRSSVRFTPWSRNAIAAAGLTEQELRDLTPPGWHLHGYAERATGPWHFSLLSLEPNVVPLTREVAVYRVADVREAIAGLLASVTPNLELQLAASLALIEGGHR